MISNPAENLGDLLRRYRQEAGLTQEELAERANLSARAISELERGARLYPYRTTIQGLGQALALSPEQLARLEQAGRRPATRRPSAAGATSAAGSAEPESGDHPHNLPVQLTSFVGRTAELARVRALLLSADVRLLTLTGPPGTGKTRLSLEVAGTLPAAFPDGVFFVDLAAVSDPALVASTVATTLGVKETPGRSLVEGLQQFLKRKQLLLVLDNFEQVLPAAALVNELLQACPQLKTLVTSREALGLRAEKEFPVPPLTMPDPRQLPSLPSLEQYEAVQLFVERARDTKPDFALTQENARAVAEICRRLDGLPLALELAAARIRIFSPQSMAGRLQHSLRLLTGGDQDLPARQQTLRAAIGWSHDLLDKPEQVLFRRLAVFAGGCTLEAIAAVCDEGDDRKSSVLEVVESLVGKSLLQQREGYGQESRFSMLEMIREYALQQLAESDELEELSRRHALYFMTLAEQVDPSLGGRDTAESFGRLEEDLENLRAALEWALQGSGGDRRAKSAIGLRLAAATWHFWDFKGYFREGRSWLEEALAQDLARDAAAFTEVEQEALDRARAVALLGAGTIAGGQAEFVTARSHIVASLSLSRKLGYQWGIMVACFVAGDHAARQGDYAMCRTCYEEALLISRELQDKLWISSMLMNLGALLLLEGDPTGARVLSEESLAISRELGVKSQIGWSLIYLGEIAYSQHELVEATALFAEGLLICRELGDPWATDLALRNLASVALEQEDLVLALAYCAEDLIISKETGDGRRIAHCLAILAGIAARDHANARRAAVLVGATEAILEATNATMWFMQRQIYDQAAATARNLLGNEHFAEAQRQGRAMSIEQVVAYALAEGEV